MLRPFPWHPDSQTNPRAKYWLPLVWTDNLLFHVMLQQSALSLETLGPGSTDFRSKDLRTECISLLRNRVQDAALSTSDGTISAVALLVALEASEWHRDLRYHGSNVRTTSTEEGTKEFLTCI